MSWIDIHRCDVARSYGIGLEWTILVLVLYKSASMDYKALRCGVADASLHHAKWGHIVAPLGVVQRWDCTIFSVLIILKVWLWQLLHVDGRWKRWAVSHRDEHLPAFKYRHPGAVVAYTGGGSPFNPPTQTWETCLLRLVSQVWVGGLAGDPPPV